MRASEDVSNWPLYMEIEEKEREIHALTVQAARLRRNIRICDYLLVALVAALLGVLFVW